MKGLPVSETATEINVKAIQQRYSEAWNSHGSDHWVIEWTMVNADLSVDCVDVIALEDGLVKTKDTYFDFAQLQVAMSALAAG